MTSYTGPGCTGQGTRCQRLYRCGPDATKWDHATDRSTSWRGRTAAHPQSGSLETALVLARGRSTATRCTRHATIPASCCVIAASRHPLQPQTAAEAHPDRTCIPRAHSSRMGRAIRQGGASCFTSTSDRRSHLLRCSRSGHIMRLTPTSPHHLIGLVLDPQPPPSSLHSL